MNRNIFSQNRGIELNHFQQLKHPVNAFSKRLSESKLLAWNELLYDCYRN